MKIIINTATINQGGAVQVALNLINYTINDPKHNYYYIIPKIIKSSGFLDLTNQDYIVVDKSPAKILNARSTKKKMKKFEARVRPDIIYSVGAPSYVFFKNLEVLRLTNPGIIGLNKIAWSTFSLFEKIKLIVRVKIQKRFIKKTHYIITQTEAAKKNINQNLKISKKNIVVIPNTYSSVFKPKRSNPKTNKLNILCLSAPYPHKNLSIIPLVARELLLKGIINFIFFITIPAHIDNKEVRKLQHYIKKYNLEKNIVNLGKVNLEDCPDLYEMASIVFLPTLLEIFSATHIEAIAMNVPIVTTDMDFCHEVCKGGALYFRPKDYKHAASQIYRLYHNSKLRENLVKKQETIIETFPKSNEIYCRHITALEKIYSRH